MNFVNRSLITIWCNPPIIPISLLLDRHLHAGYAVQSEKYHPVINLLYHKIMHVILQPFVGEFQAGSGNLQVITCTVR